MKKVMFLMFVLLSTVSMAAWAADEAPAVPSEPQAAEAATVTVYQCPMDKYASDKAGICPLCGMALAEQKMTAADAQAALDKSKDMIKQKA